MRYLLLFLLSFNISASYPEFRDGDKVELTIPGSPDHYFYKCPKRGMVTGYRPYGDHYIYNVSFSCKNTDITEVYKGKYLKKDTLKP